MCRLMPPAYGTGSSSGSGSAWWRVGWCFTSRCVCSSGWHRRSMDSVSHLLGLVLVVGTGAGTAPSSQSWLSVGGHQIGQPSELAKIATVLMLARYLSGRKEPPRSLQRPADPRAHRRRAVPPRAQAARPGQRHRLHRNRLRDAVLGGRASTTAFPHRLARGQPAPRLQHGGVGRLDRVAGRGARRLASLPRGIG